MFPVRMYKESFVHVVSEGYWYEPFEVGRSKLPVPYKIPWTEVQGKTGENIFTFHWTEEA